MKKRCINFLFLIIILWVLFGIINNPKLSLDSGYNGLLTWFNIVIPSLLPFFIVSEILTSIGFVNLIGKLLEPLMKPLFNAPGAAAFALSMSVVSGYPIGAKIVSDLRKDNIISKIEAERTICFSSTSGPLFMLGAVSIGMLKNSSIAPLIMYPHYLGTITLGILFRFYKKNNSPSTRITKYKPNTPTLKDNFAIGTILGNSVKNSLNTIALIGGFIIFYSVLTELLFVSKLFNQLINVIINIIPIDISIEVIKGFIAGLLELTTGCKIISTANVNLIYKILVINFLIGWSSFSIHSQALSFINNTDIDSKIYLFAKFLHGLFSSIYGAILYLVKYKNFIKPSYMPGIHVPESFYPLGWPSLFLGSLKLAIFITIYMLISSLILLILYAFLSRD
ncbi:sporulation integral membrane protein YlbJ [Clostridium sp. Cult2]|uniref:sporulation integral membrane protein YlbJ n=1 Tax=Clostridium sp. Cult2 TaxID=2079003 RepID=UPI001EFF6275|nr:sporulation integral membrane protein YlbJ [Clostridium sp. Cult2]MCF6466415.1 sporulation integral membrane protein YlbJ [Clostridium sp. Cult2]